MRIKSVAIDTSRVKAGPEDGLNEGEFLVYPSTFTREPDAYGDVVAKGAFANGITKRKESGIILPGLFGHRMDDPDFYVAHAIEEGEDDHGWWVKGAFDLDDPKAAKVYRLVKGRRINELSFAYDVLGEGQVQLEDGRKANELRDLEVFEFSFVPVGANRDTSVVAIKSAVDALAGAVKAGEGLASSDEGTVRAALDTLADAVTSLKNVLSHPEAGDNQETKANGSEPANGEEPEWAKSEEPTRGPSARYLGLINISTAQ